MKHATSETERKKERGVSVETKKRKTFIIKEFYTHTHIHVHDIEGEGDCRRQIEEKRRMRK